VSNNGPYLDFDCCERQNFLIPRLQELATQLARRPDVENVALANQPPMYGYDMAGLFLANRQHVPEVDDRSAGWFAGSPTYFATTGRKLSRGRFFTDADRGSRVIVVNETAARAYWPNENPLGQCLRVFRDTMPCSTVVGVMKDSHLANVVERATAQVVSLARETPTGMLKEVQYLIVRAAPARVGTIARVLRAEMQKRFPPSASIVVTSMADVLEPQIRPWRLGATIFVAFGALALVVAAVGTYSVIAYAVSQRAHEMSVRVALGARAADLLRLIVGQGVRLAVLGVVCGSVVAIVASHVIASLLYETSARDPLIVGAVALLLVLVATIASGIPAWRATRADPVVALRSD
jgi:ABC-type antimicrobial peptide transport system permease subunit